jgi:alpha-mannosidase
VVRAGYELNVPLRVLAVKPRAGTLPTREALLEVEAENIIVEAMKQAEDGDDVIVRLYEAHGASTRTAVRLGFAAREVALVDLMEEHPQALKLVEGTVTLAFRPFEIHTLRIKR